MNQNADKSKWLNLALNVITIILGLFFVYLSFNFLTIYLLEIEIFPNIEYSFPYMAITSAIISLLFAIFVFSFVLRPNRITDKIEEWSELDLSRYIDGVMLMLLVLTIWFIFGNSIADGILAFELRTIVGMEITELFELTMESLIINSALMFIPFVLIPILWVKFINNGNYKKYLGLHTENLTKNIILGIIFAAITLLLAFLLTQTLSIFGIEEQNLLFEEMVALGPIMALIISLSAGIAEEIFFRGYLQTRIGLVPAAILFALVHASYGVIIQIIGPLIMGLVIGYLYLKTQSVIGPIIAHTLYNLTVLLTAIYII
ncbi:Metal-dependent membrane protease CAAX family [Methanonatronarchaeum thermophilum]|uniref:Metal-dependent membrane protease CAAX family n=1 Tax=Methanonatronarchaeum thermophilum TaxID=1927129 RepID=A0A1Y3GBT4_9EURY|nr:type II CAAX endopeptidase family protein [Methanonatronarchaeum thermophilum]OUJ18717.1 Metal-dependent membrane protease CAAX family [Methanonatronarchaeum thermophilum]